jgi:hypothetical protein
MQPSLAGKLRGLSNIVLMRNLDTLLKKTMPHQWYAFKEKKSFELAEENSLS